MFHCKHLVPYGADRLDALEERVEDACMEQSIGASSELVGWGAERNRHWRTVEEKRRIVGEVLAPGASVAQVGRLHGVNANQVFQWHCEYRAGDCRTWTVVV